MALPDKDACDHNWLVTYTWWAGYRVALVCLRCHDRWPLPGRWWRRSGMEAEAHRAQAEVAAGQRARLDRLLGE